MAGWYSWISLVSYPVDTRVNHTRDRSLTVAIYGYNLLPPGPEDWQEIQRPSLRKARSAMTVKKNNAPDDDQEAKVGGNVVTVNHNSSEPLVKVDVQTGVAKEVTVVVKVGTDEDEPNWSKRKGETPRSPPKTNPWNEFLKQHRGTQLTIKQLSALYKEKKKRHESLTTDGS